jgi:exonuclease III
MRFRKGKDFNIGTFNVRGLVNGYKQEQLSRDIEKYKIDICCLQETKIRDNTDTIVNGHRLITIQTNCQYYGNGFLISSKWKNSVHNYWKISDRIAVLQLRTDEATEEEHIQTHYKSVMNGMRMKITKKTPKKIITIINVYAPTTERVKKNMKELDDMYMQLNDLINNFKNDSTSVLLIAGDFNAKIGKAEGITKVAWENTLEAGETIVAIC